MKFDNRARFFVALFGFFLAFGLLLGTAPASQAQDTFVVEVLNHDDPVDRHGNFTVDVEITNIGTEQRSEEVQLLFENEEEELVVQDDEVFSLDGGDSVQHTFAYEDVTEPPTDPVPPASTDDTPNSYEFEVTTEETRDEPDGDFVTELRGEYYSPIENVQVSPEQAFVGDTIQVTADITNSGPDDSSVNAGFVQDVELLINDELVETATDVAINTGSQDTVEFEVDATEDISGEFNVEVCSLDDCETSEAAGEVVEPEPISAEVTTETVQNEAITFGTTLELFSGVISNPNDDEVALEEVNLSLESALGDGATEDDFDTAYLQILSPDDIPVWTEAVSVDSSTITFDEENLNLPPPELVGGEQELEFRISVTAEDVDRIEEFNHNHQAQFELSDFTVSPGSASVAPEQPTDMITTKGRFEIYDGGGEDFPFLTVSESADIPVMYFSLAGRNTDVDQFLLLLWEELGNFIPGSNQDLDFGDIERIRIYEYNDCSAVADDCDTWEVNNVTPLTDQYDEEADQFVSSDESGVSTVSAQNTDQSWPPGSNPPVPGLDNRVVLNDAGLPAAIDDAFIDDLVTNDEAYLVDRLGGFELARTTNNANFFVTIETNEGWDERTGDPEQNSFGFGDGFSVGMVDGDTITDLPDSHDPAQGGDVEHHFPLELNYEPPDYATNSPDTATTNIDERSPIIHQSVGPVTSYIRTVDKFFGNPDENWDGRPGLEYFPPTLMDLRILGPSDSADDGSANAALESVSLEFEIPPGSDFNPEEDLRDLSDGPRSGLQVWMNTAHGSDQRGQEDEVIPISPSSSSWSSDGTEVTLELQDPVELPTPDDDRIAGGRTGDHEVNRGITRSNSSDFTFYVTALVDDEAPRGDTFTVRLQEEGLGFNRGENVYGSPYSNDEAFLDFLFRPFASQTVSPVFTFPRDLVDPEQTGEDRELSAPSDPEPAIGFRATGGEDIFLDGLDFAIGDTNTADGFTTDDLKALEDGGVALYRLRADAEPGEYDPDQDHRLPIDLARSDKTEGAQGIPDGVVIASAYVDHSQDSADYAVTSDQLDGEEMGDPEFYLAIQISDNADNDDRFTLRLGQESNDDPTPRNISYVDENQDSVVNYSTSASETNRFHTGWFSVNTVTSIQVSQRPEGDGPLPLAPSSPPTDVLGIEAEAIGGDQELEEMWLTFDSGDTEFVQGQGVLRSMDSDTPGISLWTNNTDDQNFQPDEGDTPVEIINSSWESDTELHVVFDPEPIRYSEPEGNEEENFFLAVSTSEDFRPGDADTFTVTIEEGDIGFSTERSVGTPSITSRVIQPATPFFAVESAHPQGDTVPFQYGETEELFMIQGVHVGDDSDTISSVVLDRDEFSDTFTLASSLESTEGAALGDSEPRAGFELWRSADNEFDRDEDTYIPLESITRSGEEAPASDFPVILRVDQDAAGESAVLPDDYDSETRFFVVANASRQITPTTEFSMRIEESGFGDAEGGINTQHGISRKTATSATLVGEPYPPAEVVNLIDQETQLRAAVGDTEAVRDHRQPVFRIELSDNGLPEDEYLDRIALDLDNIENLDWPEMVAESDDVSSIADPDTPLALEVWRVEESTFDGQIDPEVHDRLPTETVSTEQDDLFITFQESDTAVLPPTMPVDDSDSFFVLTVNAGMDIQGDPDNGEQDTEFSLTLNSGNITTALDGVTTDAFFDDSVTELLTGISYPETDYQDVGEGNLQPSERFEAFHLRADDYGGEERLEELRLEVDEGSLNINQLAQTADVDDSDTPAAFELWLSADDQLDTGSDTYVPMTNLDVDPDFEDPVEMTFADTPALDIANVHPDGDPRFILVMNASEQIMSGSSFTLRIPTKAMTTTNTTTSQETAEIEIEGQAMPGDPQITAVSFQRSDTPAEGGRLKGNQFWAHVEIDRAQEAFLSWEYATEDGDVVGPFETSTTATTGDSFVFRFSKLADQLDGAPPTVPLTDDGDSVNAVYLLKAWGVSGEGQDRVDSPNRELTDSGDSVPIWHQGERDPNLRILEIDEEDVEEPEDQDDNEAIVDVEVQLADSDDSSSLEHQTHETLRLEWKFLDDVDWTSVDEDLTLENESTTVNVPIEFSGPIGQLAEGDTVEFRARGEDEDPTETQQVVTPWSPIVDAFITGIDQLVGIDLPEEGLARAVAADGDLGVIISFGGTDFGRAQDPTINPGEGEELRVQPDVGVTVSMTIFTTSGEYVAEAGPSNTEISWDGSADGGPTVNNGVYIVRINANGTQTFPVMVLQ